jgi:hypothetical protein
MGEEGPRGGRRTQEAKSAECIVSARGFYKATRLPASLAELSPMQYD